ncbi:liver-expressed antimicrobial peptide 2-like [Myxocyprinus asiaticus]|uniref:liver-expressed antimicrobial peptide 2-like n=1 Tax=Myxocyprinus asiaticus TaxID=70543 RepID=UPI002223A919|nr:liver-expressed antimicrobial peptide 2-like [Myxocyprinus asiaticus]
MHLHHFNLAKFGYCMLLLLVLIYQASSVPVVTHEVQSDLQPSHRLHRKIRMSPLWRIMGFKPYGAYCQDNIECSTGFCRNGHCSFNGPVHS